MDENEAKSSGNVASRLVHFPCAQRAEPSVESEDFLAREIGAVLIELQLLLGERRPPKRKTHLFVSGLQCAHACC